MFDSIKSMKAELHDMRDKIDFCVYNLSNADRTFEGYEDPYIHKNRKDLYRSYINKMRSLSESIESMIEFEEKQLEQDK